MAVPADGGWVDGFGLFLLAIGIVLAGIGVVVARRDSDSRGWPTVEGTVQRTSVVAKRHGVASVETEVAYRVRGEAYTRVETVVGDVSLRSSREEAIRRLPPGQVVVVHHDPIRPQVSRVRTGIGQPAVLYLALGLVTAAIGIASLTGSLG